MSELSTPLTAFLIGLATSVHCAVMCGPLGCALMGGGTRTAVERRQTIVGYHLARVTSYTLLGALLGGFGQSAAAIFHAPVSKALPWAMILLLVFIAFGWERRIPRIPLFDRFFLRLRLRAASSPPRQIGLLLGALTPLLPCGPLYLVLATAMISGSWLTGASFSAAFSAGTVPFYLLTQVGAFHWQSQLSPRVRLFTVRGLALCSAFLVAGRSLLQSDVLAGPIKCLLCH